MKIEIIQRLPVIISLKKDVILANPLISTV